MRNSVIALVNVSFVRRLPIHSSPSADEEKMDELPLTYEETRTTPGILAHSRHGLLTALDNMSATEEKNDAADQQSMMNLT